MFNPPPELYDAFVSAVRDYHAALPPRQRNAGFADGVVAPPAPPSGDDGHEVWAFAYASWFAQLHGDALRGGTYSAGSLAPPPPIQLVWPDPESAPDPGPEA